jgi:hypothetical protein
MRKHLSAALAAIALALAGFVAHPADARPFGGAASTQPNLRLISAGAGLQDDRFFPETGRTIGGVFLDFWQRNGGLAVFGYPLTERLQEGGRDAQYVERQRFELHSENQAPYNVLLGRLGAQLLELRGVSWQTGAASPDRACLWFSQTQRNVCDQGGGVGFRSYWSSHGLEFDGRRGTSYAESLALFGYPLTEATLETNSNGVRVITQWFERARFEWYPDNPSDYKVLLGRLGAELLEAQGRQPQPGPPTFTQVQITLIALEDNGRSGKKIGCNDSAIPVTVSVEPTTAPLTAALERLFSIKSDYYGESGLYNALYRSSLRIESVHVASGRADIRLVGNLQLGGVCDNPRVEAQIKETARQFSTVDEVVVYLNGQRLEDVLSGR